MCLISWQSGRLINETIHLAVDTYVAANWCTLCYSIVSISLATPPFMLMSCYIETGCDTGLDDVNGSRGDNEMGT